MWLYSQAFIKSKAQIPRKTLMSLNKAIEHKKEKRKPFRKSKAFDATCRNHGSCSYCEQNRTFSSRKKIQACKCQVEEVQQDIE